MCRELAFLYDSDLPTLRRGPVMLLTLSQSGKPEFGVRPPHELASPPPPPSQHSGFRFSPHRPLDRVLAGGGLPNNYAMSTSHRGLPPPSAMTLPDPNRQQPPPPPPPPHQSSSLPSQSQLGALPAPPSQWQGGEDSMRHWLSTKAEEERTRQEEEKRRQEEERTRQESFKLEQRLVEQTMLRESMKGGIPPQMIPVIFAGIGGPSLVSASVEMLHQYAAQLQASQQQVQVQAQAQVAIEPSPEQSRETRLVNPPQPNPYAAPAQASSTSTQPPPPLSQHQSTFSAYGTSNRAGPSGPTSAPRSVPASGLSRINTIDLAQPTSTSQAHGGQSDQTSSSPSIYFHHWVPPATQETKGHQPPTPSGRNEPSSAHPSHGGEADFKDSPRKRKAVGGHGPLPPPSQTSPSFSSQSSTRSRGNSAGHMRSRSNKSNEDQSEASRRPPSRRDSVATQARMQEHSYVHETHSRPPSHAGNRSPVRREYMR